MSRNAVAATLITLWLTGVATGAAVVTVVYYRQLDAALSTHEVDCR